MPKEISPSTLEVLFIARVAVFTALTFVLTVMFSAYLPSTRGYFNFGEIGVYISGLVGGPLVGAIAGGLGSMLSDIVLGYAWYAPATLIIKGIEGGVVGWTSRKISNLPRSKKKLWVVLATLSLMSIYLFWFLIWALRGSISITLHLLQAQADPLGIQVKPYTFSVSWRIGLIGSLVLAVVLSILAIYLINKGLYLYVPCLIGGSSMVSGYFIYEAFILGMGIEIASIEIPINLGQMIVGALVSVPVIQYLQKAGLEVSTGSKEGTHRT